jgi:hypothetical protein
LNTIYDVERYVVAALRMIASKRRSFDSGKRTLHYQQLLIE